jgi:hypothetical protein
MGKNSALQLDEELNAVAETGLYESKEAFLADAVHTLMAARPEERDRYGFRRDVRELLLS